jgi:uncharacterized damage-inducible protein DinB
MEDLRYPIGTFAAPERIAPEDRKEHIGQLEEAPGQLRETLRGLTREQLQTPYREGGWTLLQVAHHLPDSHLNAYVRFRLALTEEQPAIKAYREDLWAELPDARTAPAEPSLALLEALHERWVLLLRALTPDEWRRAFLHSELGAVTLEQSLALYAWHGRHHVAQVTALRKRMQW